MGCFLYPYALIKKGGWKSLVEGVDANGLEKALQGVISGSLELSSLIQDIRARQQAAVENTQIQNLERRLREAGESYGNLKRAHEATQRQLQEAQETITNLQEKVAALFSPEYESTLPAPADTPATL